MSSTTTTTMQPPSPNQTEVERNTNPITLTRFINAERNQFKESSGSFALLLQSIQLACKVIGNATRKAGIANLYGVSGTTNSSGDSQKKLDVLANDVMINCITFSDQVFAMVSEEVDDLIIVDNKNGGYAVVFDPLDGSSNIDCNLSVGTIFGIYKKRTTPTGATCTHPTSLKDILRPGDELLAAGYASYDAATIMGITTGNGVNMFTLDPSLGEFILTSRNVRIPPRGKVYSINEGNAKTWDTPTQRYIQMLKERGNMSGRYVGSMVGDVHRTLLYGGIFCYPADKKNPQGKLRLLYECNPISFLIEQAGGRSTTGTQRVMEIRPTELHQRCPIFCGSPEDVREVEALYREQPASERTAAASRL